MTQPLSEGVQPVTVCLPSTALLWEVLLFDINTGNSPRLFLTYIVLITPERVTHSAQCAKLSTASVTANTLPAHGEGSGEPSP